MDLVAHYDTRRQAALLSLSRGEAAPDTLLDSPPDTRRGLTVLAHSIDQRYRLQTAHSTVVRFHRPLASPAQLVAAPTRCQQQFIDTFEVWAI
jgi:hypothetical protein